MSPCLSHKSKIVILATLFLGSFNQFEYFVFGESHNSIMVGLLSRGAVAQLVASERSQSGATSGLIWVRAAALELGKILAAPSGDFSPDVNMDVKVWESRKNGWMSHVTACLVVGWLQFVIFNLIIYK